MVIERVRGLSGRRAVVWAVPVVVAAAVGVGAAVVAPSSGAVPSLPKRTAVQLLADVQRHAAGTALTGEVREVANLGFPSLPGAADSASLSWQDFITGSHSARVWVDGDGKQRVALLGELSEADVTHNGRDVWTYTSSTNTATHTVLPAADSAHDQLPAGSTPTSVALRLLKAASPSTRVSVDNAQRVAGRASYTLVLRPRDPRSTVREVRIAVDAATFVPLRLQLLGAGSKPAFQIGFSSVSFSKPAASTFRFSVPKGATVSTDPLGTRSDGRRHGRHSRADKTSPRTLPKDIRAGAAPRRPTVIGSGWTSVLEFPTGIGSAGGMVDRLTTRVGSSGTRLLHTSLVNAVFLPDGRVFAGAVSPALLEHIARTTR